VLSCWQRGRTSWPLDEGPYVICPLVEDSERLEATSAVARAHPTRTRGVARARRGILHGQMRDRRKKDDGAFRAGDWTCWLATVVIEVGVDVPEASVIVH